MEIVTRYVDAIVNADLKIYDNDDECFSVVVWSLFGTADYDISVYQNGEYVTHKIYRTAEYMTEEEFANRTEKSVAQRILTYLFSAHMPHVRYSK